MTAPLTALALPHGTLALPAFLPDATLGVVRAVDAADLRAAGIAGLVMNTFHLMQRPGSSTVTALGGLHAMSGWDGPIITDSGGFQAYSLIAENPKNGRLGANGLTFQTEGSAHKYQLTPEKTVQLQVSYGADVVICLDQCTHVDAPEEEQARAVARTVAWAARGKAEFTRLMAQKRLGLEARPLLFAVIQGGGSRDLRRRCAEELLAIGFDGFGYGGWPLDRQGHLLADIIGYTRALIPPALPVHALGVGGPENIRTCTRLGYTLFDSALPTRDARHGRLVRFTQDPATVPDAPDARWYEYVYIQDDKYIKAREPIEPGCPCPACTQYSLGYLHHLFAVKETLALRLATLHNLCFMSRLDGRAAGGGACRLRPRPRASPRWWRPCWRGRSTAR